VFIIKDESTGREWTVNIHILRPFNERSFLNSSTARTKETLAIESSRDDSLAAEFVPQDAGAANSDSPRDASSSTAKHTLNKRPRFKIIFDRDHDRVTKQESERSRKRKLDQTTEESAEDALVEYEIDKVLSHKRTRRGMMYEVKFLEFDNPKMIHANRFMTTDILKEYWSKHSNSARPAQFKSSTSARGRAR
jgi:hypothetical protein